MTGYQNSLYTGDDFVYGRAIVVEQIDFVQTVTIEQRQATGGRNIDSVVEIDAQHVAFGLHHTDDSVAIAADADPVIQRIGRVVEFRMHT